jgi:hypothetical protein
MRRTAPAILALAALAASAQADLYRVTMQVTNLAPVNGAIITPVWVAAHDGTFDIFNVGQTAPQFLERLAEDGLTQPLDGAFWLSERQNTSATIRGNGLPGFEQFRDIIPGETQSIDMILDSNNPAHRYFSFAHMVVPSNDAFSANPDPVSHPLFNAAGQFVGQDFTTNGNVDIWDAGTEVNDEVPMNTALLAQPDVNIGVPQGGSIALHPGFMGSARLGGTRGNILNAPYAVNADFTVPGGYPFARFEFEAVIIPAPASGLVMLVGLALARRRR